LFGLYFGFLPFETTNYNDFEASPLCSGDSDRVEQFLKIECPLTRDILGLNIESDFIVLLSKMLNIDPAKRPEVSEVLLTDTWVRGHIIDHEEYESKVLKLSSFLHRTD